MTERQPQRIGARVARPGEQLPAGRQRVAILGRGFGGLRAAQRLRGAPVDITRNRGTRFITASSHTA